MLKTSSIKIKDPALPRPTPSGDWTELMQGLDWMVSIAMIPKQKMLLSLSLIVVFYHLILSLVVASGVVETSLEQTVVLLVCMEHMLVSTDIL